MLGVFDAGSNLLGVVEALDDVERNPERHQLRGLVDDIVGAVEDQVPQDRGNDDAERFFEGVQDGLATSEGHEDGVSEADEHG